MCPRVAWDYSVGSELVSCRVDLASCLISGFCKWPCMGGSQSGVVNKRPKVSVIPKLEGDAARLFSLMKDPARLPTHKLPVGTVIPDRKMAIPN